MATFDWPYHKFSVKYPETGLVVSFGRSWDFAAAPEAPDQREITLTFPGLRYFVDDAGAIYDGAEHSAGDPEYDLNLYRLELFYQQHRRWKNFTYPHPVYGNLTVRFRQPLQIPDGLEDGDGAVEGVEVVLVEVPGV